MEAMLNKLIDICTEAGSKILLAIIIYIVGKIIIGRILKFIEKSKLTEKMDPTLRTFLSNAARIVLYIVLVISIISVLGVPMASVITVLASAGVAVGMAMQGALGNLAGGIMLMIFRPFSVGDYIDAAGESGTVKAIAMFYTELLTIDNKYVTIPNGTLMNSNVTNYSREPLRRVDIDFNCGHGQDISKIQEIMLEEMQKCGKILTDPAPFARISGATDTAMTFTLRAWVKNEDYWDVYFDLCENVVTALGAAGITGPTVSVQTRSE